MMRQILEDFKRPVQNRRGIAILIATACIIIITYFAMEVTYDSTVEYTVNSQGLNRLKAYYAARAGVDIALLRIKVFQKISSQYGKQLGSSAGMLDAIWQIPFSWPLPAPEELNAVDKDKIKDVTKGSMMDATYLVTIEDEGSKIDLNDLNSQSKVLRDNARAQLLNIFFQKVKNDEEFSKNYSNFRFEDLIDSIQGWMSSASKLNSGTDKRPAYQELNSAAGSEYFPPNRAFRTLEELHIVPMMNDDFYKILEPVITIYGMKGINPNIANKDVIKSLDAGLTDEVVTEIIKRRDDQTLGGPFKDAQDFWAYAGSKGARIEGDTSKIPLIFDSIMNFRIKSTGQFGNVSSEITAVVMDFGQTAGKIKGYVAKESAAGSGAPGVPGAGAAGGAAAKTAAPTATSDSSQKGPPRIVYWSEK